MVKSVKDDAFTCERINSLGCKIFPTFGEGITELIRRRCKDLNYFYSDGDAYMAITDEPTRVALLPVSIYGKAFYELAYVDERFIGNQVGKTKPALSVVTSYDEGVMYRGKTLSENACRKANGYFVTDCGDVYHGNKKLSVIVVNARGRNKPKVSAILPRESLHNLPHFVYSAFSDVPLDVINILSWNISQLDYYLSLLNDDKVTSEIRMALMLRQKGFECNVDHINNDTMDNSIRNLQLVTKSTNLALKTIRRMGREICDRYTINGVVFERV